MALSIPLAFTIGLGYGGSWDEPVNKAIDLNRDGRVDPITAHHLDGFLPVTAHVSVSGEDHATDLFALERISVLDSTHFVFVADHQNFSAAASMTADRFRVGEAVRLQDGSVGRIESFAFETDDAFNVLETSARVLVPGLAQSADVPLESLRPIPKEVRLLLLKE